MAMYHVRWTDEQGNERMVSMCADTFQDAVKHIGCTGTNIREDDLGVSQVTYDIDNGAVQWEKLLGKV